MTTAAIVIPAGFRANSKGHLVPENQIGQVDMVIDDFVQELADKWKAQRDSLAQFKEQVFGDIHALVATINDEYKVKRGGEKGNVQFFSFDGRYKVVFAVNDVLKFGPELQAAREKIIECVQGWIEGAKPELLTIVNEAFSADGSGGIIVSRILQIKRYRIDSEDWKLAMKALDDALRVVGTKQYARLYERNKAGAYLPIPLDIAAL